MPSKKKKYNARFPAGRIKKIMQTDEEVGKIAQAVPIIISRTLELFVESLLNKTIRITNARNAKTLSPSHMKQCIMSENRFDFLRELVKNIPDINVSEDLSSSECASPGSPNQLEINLQPQEPIQISISSAAVAAAAGSAFKPNNNNNTNGRNGHRGMLHSSKSVDLPHQQQQNWDSSIYSTNHPFNNLGNLSEDIPTTSQTTGPNFYTEISDSSIIQYSPEKNDFCVKPPKFSRLDSAPSIMSSTSHFKCTNSELLTPLNLTKTGTATTYNDFTTKMTGRTNKRKTDQQPPMLAPIIKTKNNSIDFSVPSTSKNIPSPPVIKLDICNSPVVKIDYSNLTLSPTSFGYNNILPSPSVVVNNEITNSSYNQSPIINIDFSNLNSFNFNTKSTAVLNQQMPSTATTSSSALEMDEDYDNI